MIPFMDEGKIYTYTLGFIFDTELKRVLLVHKQKPEWQKGRINGIGGKFEVDETPSACISRETFEEAKLVIPGDQWLYVGAIYQEAGAIAVLATVYAGDAGDAVKNDYEEVEWFDAHELPENVISNLRWLIPLSLEKLDNKFDSFTVKY